VRKKVKINAYSSYATNITAMGTHAKGSHTTCHPTEVTFPPLPQSIKAGIHRPWRDAKLASLQKFAVFIFLRGFIGLIKYFH